MINKPEMVNILEHEGNNYKDLEDKIIILKFGGSVLNQILKSKIFLDDLKKIRELGVNIVIIHGGGKEISKYLSLLNINTQFIDGLRVTDKKTMEIVEMVLSGKINKKIVSTFQVNGIDAIGLSGKDCGLIMAKKKLVKNKDLGFVGEVKYINKNLLKQFFKMSIIPVISPIGMDHSGITYNINADEVAVAIAKELGADKLIYLTDVDGVYVLIEGKEFLIPKIKADQASYILKNQLIKDGMIPKIECCVKAVFNGIKEVCILNGTNSHNLIKRIAYSQLIGTTFLK